MWHVWLSVRRFGHVQRNRYVRRKKGESDKEYGDRVEAKLQMKLNMQDEIAGWRMVVSKNTKGLVTSAHAMKEVRVAALVGVQGVEQPIGAGLRRCATSW